MRLVHQHEHVVRMGERDDGAQVRADPVVGRIVDEDGLRVRIGRNRRLDVRKPHPQRNAELGIHLRVHVHGNRPVHDERVDRRAVYVARQDDLLPGLDGCEDHRLHGGRRAVHDEECVVSAERLRRQRLRVLDDRHGVREIVERLHGVDVKRHQLGAEILVQRRIHAPALVAGHVEMRQAVDPLLFQSLGNRRIQLIERLHRHPSTIERTLGRRMVPGGLLPVPPLRRLLRL